jgi:hypothetical protein
LKDGVVHLAIADCARATHALNTAGYLCGDKEGILWWCRLSVLDARCRHIPYNTRYAIREELRRGPPFISSSGAVALAARPKSYERRTNALVEWVTFIRKKVTFGATRQETAQG